jgi:hypothetical protein
MTGAGMGAPLLDELLLEEELELLEDELLLDEELEELELDDELLEELELEELLEEEVSVTTAMVLVAEPPPFATTTV